MSKLEYIGVGENIIDLFDNDYFYLTNIDGFTLATADIASGTTPSIDGDIVNNVTVQPRPVVLDLRVKQGANVAEEIPVADDGVFEPDELDAPANDKE